MVIKDLWGDQDQGNRDEGPSISPSSGAVALPIGAPPAVPQAKKKKKKRRGKGSSKNVLEAETEVDVGAEHNAQPDKKISKNKQRKIFQEVVSKNPKVSDSSS